MKIKHLSILLAAITLCACGGAKQNQNNSNAASTAKTESVSEPQKGGENEENTNIEESPFVPSSYTGDLNSDGFQDSISVEKSLQIFFGTENGNYKLFKKCDVDQPEVGTLVMNAYISNGGDLVVTTNYNCESYQDYVYTLRFQNGDFELINFLDFSGLDYSSESEYDFIEFKGKDSGSNPEDYPNGPIYYDLKKAPLIKISDIKIGNKPDGLRNFFK